MSKILKVEPRVRYVTKGVQGKVDNILQHYIWKEIVDKMRIKEDELLEISLKTCPCGTKQRVEIKDTLGRNIEDEMCFFVPERCEEEIYVVYDKETHSETMMLASEAPARSE